MTRAEAIVAFMLLAGILLILYFTIADVKMRRLNEFPTLSEDDKLALSTLESLSASIEVYYTRHQVLPYDPQGPDEALCRVSGVSISESDGHAAGQETEASRRQGSPVRIEYLNPPPDFEPMANPFVILLAARPVLEDQRFSFYLASDGSVYRCAEARTKDTNTTMLVGIPLTEALNRLNHVLIGTREVPWFRNANQETN